MLSVSVGVCMYVCLFCVVCVRSFAMIPSQIRIIVACYLPHIFSFYICIPFVHLRINLICPPWQEPVGTHGLFKAHFSAPIKQNDAVILNLYKRVFPKMPRQFDNTSEGHIVNAPIVIL